MLVLQHKVIVEDGCLIKIVQLLAITKQSVIIQSRRNKRFSRRRNQIVNKVKLISDKLSFLANIRVHLPVQHKFHRIIAWLQLHPYLLLRLVPSARKFSPARILLQNGYLQDFIEVR